MKIRRNLLSALLGFSLTMALVSGSAFAESITENVTETAAEFAVEGISEGTAEDMTEAEFLTEVAAETMSENAAESETELTSEGTAETISEESTETTTEAGTEGISETEAVTESMSEVEYETEAVTELVSETTIAGETEIYEEAENTLAAENDENDDGIDDAYDINDVKIIQTIIASSEALSANYDKMDPASWDFVGWSNNDDASTKYRIIDVSFHAASKISSTGVTDYVGTLDVSGLTNLTSLWCNNNPGLTAISVPNSLTGLAISFTGITVLDVSECLSLETLHCLEMPLTSLDVSCNTALSTLYINGPISSLKTANGSVNIAYDSNYGKITINNFIMENQTADIIVEPHSGYVFSKWEGLPEALAENDINIELSGIKLSDNLNLTAHFGVQNDVDGDGYHDGDVAVIQEIFSQSAALSSRYDVNDISTWEFVTWCRDNTGNDLMRADGIRFGGMSDYAAITDISGTLDVSSLDYLHTLLCQDNPGITGLLLPNGSTFYYLDCSFTGVTSLDVSGCPNLDTLCCYYTNLTALDVSKNPLLTQLECSRTDITMLDISKNTFLEELGIRDNPNLSLLNTSKGEFTFYHTEGGEVLIWDYDPVTGELFLEAYPEEGYYVSQWQYLPSDAERVDDKATFLMKGEYVHIIVDFMEYDLSLINLYIDGAEISPEFDPDVKEYTATVKNSVKKVSIVAVGSDAATIVSLNGKVDPSDLTSTENITLDKLKVGKNVFNVIVSDPKQSVKNEYTVTITRKKAADKQNTSDSSDAQSGGSSTSNSGTAESSSGTAASANNAYPEAPDTGDETMIGLYSALMLLSILAFMVYGRKINRV